MLLAGEIARRSCPPYRTDPRLKPLIPKNPAAAAEAWPRSTGRCRSITWWL